MKIWQNPKLINEKSIDILVDVAKRKAPKGYRINGRLSEKSIRLKCLDILKHDGDCVHQPLWRCPSLCTELNGNGCHLYVPEK